MRLAISLVGLALASPALAEPYNLKCEGTFTLVNAQAPPTFGGEPGVPTTWTFRVDPDAKTYCEGKCVSVLPIVRITDNRVTLQEVGAAGQPDVDVLYVERRDGTLFGVEGKADAAGDWIGTRTIRSAKCQKVPFTGFPKPLF